MKGLALSGMGRYEEAIEAGDRAIALAREMGRKRNVVMRKRNNGHVSMGISEASWAHCSVNSPLRYPTLSKSLRS